MELGAYGKLFGEVGKCHGSWKAGCNAKRHGKQRTPLYARRGIELLHNGSDSLGSDRVEILNIELLGVHPFFGVVCSFIGLRSV